MKEIHNIVDSLLDIDGSCRDLNFEAPTWDGVQAMFQYLDKTFTTCSAADEEGKTVPMPLHQEIVLPLATGGYVLACFEGGHALIKQLQVYLDCEEVGAPFVELTFFPEDIAQCGDLRSEFIDWATEIQHQLQARRLYARYENVSWQFGDIGARSGVFMVSNDKSMEA